MLVATAALLVGLTGCGSGGGAADPPSASTEATSSAPDATAGPTTPTTTTTTTPTTTSRALGGDVLEVPVEEDLVQLVPRFGDEARLSRDGTFDVRRCDAFPFASRPVAQAEATFSEPAAAPDAELVVGVYRFPDGASAATFWEDYENSLLACSGGDVVVTEDLGEHASTVPFDTATSNRVFTIVHASDVVWVVQKTTPRGPAELTEAELARLAEVTG